MPKLVLIAFILSVLLASAWKAHALIDQAGYERAELHFQEGLAGIKDQAAKDAVDDWRAAQVIAGDATDVEIRIVETIRIVEREIPKYIDRIIEIKPDCADLPELGILFSAQAEASNSRSGSIAADPG